MCHARADQVTSATIVPPGRAPTRLRTRASLAKVEPSPLEASLNVRRAEEVTFLQKALLPAHHVLLAHSKTLKVSSSRFMSEPTASCDRISKRTHLLHSLQDARNANHALLGPMPGAPVSSSAFPVLRVHIPRGVRRPSSAQNALWDTLPARRGPLPARYAWLEPSRSPTPSVQSAQTATSLPPASMHARPATPERLPTMPTPSAITARKVFSPPLARRIANTALLDMCRPRGPRLVPLVPPGRMAQARMARAGAVQMTSLSARTASPANFPGPPGRSCARSVRAAKCLARPLRCAWTATRVMSLFTRGP